MSIHLGMYISTIQHISYGHRRNSAKEVYFVCNLTHPIKAVKVSDSVRVILKLHKTILDFMSFDFSGRTKYIHIYIYIYTAVCKNFEPLTYISIYIYGVHCGKVLILKIVPGSIKSINI